MATQHILETTVYRGLGHERVQTFPAEVPSYQNYIKSDGKKEEEAYNTYWNQRRNAEWIKFPGRKV
jgi:hypothetical protein